MYLTKLVLDPRSAQARRDLGDAYEMHRTLARAFVTDDTTKPPRFLWRQEIVGSNWSLPTLLIQSTTAANWMSIRDLPNYLQTEPQTKVFNFSEMIEDSCRYRFRLVANPTVTRNGKRIGIGGEENQMAWLGRQGGKHGFNLEHVLVTSSDIMNTNKKRGVPSITIGQVSYEGVLLATQAAALIDAAGSGIGPAKAFGCGLLSLAKLS